MKRRPLVALLVGIGLTIREGADAVGAARRVRRVGVLFADRFSPDDEWDPFVSELARRGYVAGKDVEFDIRTASSGDPKQLARFAGELLRNKPDLIVTAGGSASALAAKAATSKVPIVFLGSGDPVGLGLVASLARPGGNITGISSQMFDGYAKGLELLVQLTSGLKRVVAIDPKGEGSKGYFPKYAAVLIAMAKSLDATIRFVEYESVEALGSLVKWLVEQGMDAAYFGSGPLDDASFNRRIADIFIANRVPTVGNARAGMLLEYRAPLQERSRTAAEYVDRIFKGANPGDLPVPQPNAIELLINMKTAKALGLTIPQSILLRANEVIR
jgi:putative ABC transport system substrate-binding protein